MPHQAFDWLERIKSIEREHRISRLALDWLSRDSRKDPTVLGTADRYRDLTTTANNLDGTYVIRMFAEFESGLRSY